MNLTESKYYIYGSDGILQFRVDFNDMEALYGKPISTSANGQIFVLKKSIAEISKIQNQSNQQMIEHFLRIDLMNLTIFKFSHIKAINLYKNIKEWLL